MFDLNINKSSCTFLYKTYVRFVTDNAPKTYLINDSSLLTNAVDEVRYIGLGKDNEFLVTLNFKKASLGSSVTRKSIVTTCYHEL